MDAEDFAALRKEAAESAAELKFLQEEADKFYQDIQTNQQAQMQDAAKECAGVGRRYPRVEQRPLQRDTVIRCITGFRANRGGQLC